MTGALLVTAITLASSSTASDAQTQPRKVFVRQSLHEFVNDQQKLVSLIRGVQVMRQRNTAPKDSAEYRTSWEYWANIHGYPGGVMAGKVADILQARLQRFPESALIISAMFSGLVDQTRPDDLARKVWETCKHSSRTRIEPHFLSWHRMYLYFFERVLRKASGDPDFALPYWDYTNDTVDAPDPATSARKIPSIFVAPTLQTSGGQIPNPLFESRRTAGFGSTVQLDPIDTNVDSTLALDNFQSFQNTLETTIHGFVHCAVGSACLGPYMGIVPFAGNEPIFWHHHANIDRLWQCWTERNGRDANPTADNDWMKEEFAFVDENGTPVSMKVSELFDPNGRIDFSYDKVKKCFRIEPPAVTTPVAMAANDARRRPTELAMPARVQVSKSEVAASPQVEINAIEQEVPLTSARGPGRNDALLFAVHPNSIRSSKATLTLQDIELSQEPGAAVRVYLVNKKDNRRAFVASLNFFGWSFEHKDHVPAGNDLGRTVSLDVTSQLRELQSNNVSSEGLSVVFAASSGLAGAATAVTEQAYRRAGLKIRKISLEVEDQTKVLDLR
jgi:hypothetical protein